MRSLQQESRRARSILTFALGIRCFIRNLNLGEVGSCSKHGPLIYPAGRVLFGSSSKMENRGSSIIILIASAAVVILESLSLTASNYRSISFPSELTSNQFKKSFLILGPFQTHLILCTLRACQLCFFLLDSRFKTCHFCYISLLYVSFNDLQRIQ